MQTSRQSYRATFNWGYRQIIGIEVCDTPNVYRPSIKRLHTFSDFFFCKITGFSKGKYATLWAKIIFASMRAPLINIQIFYWGKQTNVSLWNSKYQRPRFEQIEQSHTHAHDQFRHRFRSVHHRNDRNRYV